MYCTNTKFYHEDIIKKSGQGNLQTQLVPTEKSLWELSQYRKFLEFRRNKIAEEINKFMKNYEYRTKTE